MGARAGARQDSRRLPGYPSEGPGRDTGRPALSEEPDTGKAALSEEPTAPWTRETELLLYCARRRQTEESRAGIRRLLKVDIRWDRLHQLARRHGLLPLVNLHLRAESDLVPSAELERLGAYGLRNAGVMLRLTSELVHLLRWFQADDIPAVPYKGPVLSVELYGSLALRQAGDLDVLVRKRDLPKVREILQDRGYTQRYALTPSNSAFRLARRYCEDYVSPDGIHLDLHWAFTNGDIRFPLTLEMLEPRLSTMRIGGYEALTFPREDLLLILCVHGAKHRWDRLEWICGVAELLRAPELIAWDDIVTRAARLGCWRMLLLGVCLAHEVLGAPLPDDIRRKATRIHWIPRLALDVRRRFDSAAVSEGSVSGILSHNLFQLPLQDRFGDRVRFLLYRSTTPNRPDAWRTVSVGGVPVPLHSLTWPARLGAKLARRPLDYLLGGNGRTDRGGA